MKKSIFLLCMTVFLLCACSGKEPEPEGTEAGQEAQGPSFLREDEAYLAKWGEAFSDIDLMPGGYAFAKDDLYYLAYDYEDGGISSSHIFRKRQGQDAEAFFSIEKEYISYLFTDQEGAVYCILSDPKEAAPHLMKWNPDGEAAYDAAVLFEDADIMGLMGQDAQSLKESFLTCQSYVLSQDGTICLLDYSGNLYLLDAAGNLTGVIPWEDAGASGVVGQGLVDAGEDGLYYYSLSEKEVSLRPIDLANAALGQPIPIETDGPATPLSLYSGGKEGILIVEDEGLILYSPSGNMAQKLLSWDDESIQLRASEIEMASLEENGDISLLVQDGYRNASRLVALEKCKKEELPQVQTVTVGVITANDGSYGTEWYEKVAQEFHKVYPAYRLEVKTYATDGMDFEMDLLRGEGPDLIELAYLDADMLAGKGVLEDLSPYLDAGNVHREELLDAVLSAGTIDGKLIRLMDGFSVQGMVVDSGVTATGGWTPKELLDMVEANPGVPYSWMPDKVNLLYYALCMDMDEYVDWTNLECHFQDKGFTDLLKRISSLDLGSAPGFMPPYLAVYFRDHEILTVATSISRWEGYLELKEAYGEDACFAGYPNQAGEPKYRITTSYVFGMNSASQQKEGAWAFLELLLSKDYQKDLMNSGFSVRKDVLEKQFQTSLYTNVVSRVNPYDGLPYTEPLPQAGKEDFDFLQDMIDHAYFGGNSTDTIYRILSEEAADYFTGEKDAEQVAEVIQSRVSLYLQE